MEILPTLRQLRYLVALRDSGHFGRAAEACLVTQSTLSAGIKELETLLDVTLVERTRRRVVFTPLGDQVARQARALLRDAADLAETARSGRDPLTGAFHLGVIPTIGPYVIPPALPKLRAAHPDLRLFLREDQTAHLLARLRDGSLDAALIALPFDVQGLDTVILGSDGLMLACAPDHPLAARDRVTEADLIDQPVLLLEGGHCLRDHAIQACHLSTLAGNEVFQATSMATLVQMVAAGLGVTLLPTVAAAVEGRPGSGLTLVPLAGGEEARDIVLVWRHGTAREADCRRLADFLAPHCGPD